MADNYLEKRFEEHNAKTTQKRQHSKPTKIRRVFVTGGASGIGRMIVKTLRVAGNNVAFCDLDEEKGIELSSTTGTLFFHLDVRNVNELESAMDSVCEKWGDIDIVINNVGVSTFIPLAESTVEYFDDILSINLRPVFVTSRKMALYREIGEKRYGRIVNICSTRYRQSESGTEAYTASKGAIASLTHSLAVSMAKYGITVNCISPGWIENYNYDTLKAEDHSQHPSGRVGKPEDIARIVRFLCEEENDFVNGENIVCDGGMTRKMIYVE
ncbi:MAG: SDR family oxidoreductase [Bacteroidales bacterium]|nr:SDR family oxidoreductase [Bacteroidales bacterium]